MSRGEIAGEKRLGSRGSNKGDLGTQDTLGDVIVGIPYRFHKVYPILPQLRVKVWKRSPGEGIYACNELSQLRNEGRLLFER